MSHTPRPAVRPWRRHLRRALGAERNQLSRPLDRARSRALLLAALGLALAAALATTAALAELTSAQRQTAVTSAHLHHLDAVVLTPARRTPPSTAPGRVGHQAKASWTYPAGRLNTGTIGVARHTAPGTTVGIWVTDTGRLSAAPASSTDLAAGAAYVGLLTLGFLSVLIASALGLRLNRLARRAARGWQDSWTRLEPAWTGRSFRSPGTTGDTQLS
ncbi:hypothetical protein [Kitasatospora sp. NPDC050543]|uniref:Rv1733c family protein n=1 Tax=Kitasatospora sp. NPDC050543 TaxID=3364054 RepID=UPI00378EF26E